MTNLSLDPLPSDDEVVAAVRALVDERRDGYGYFNPCPTANLVARQLGVQPARRLGNGAVKGTWSGRMAPGLRLAPRLTALTKAGRLVRTREDYRWVYDVAGEEWWRRKDDSP